MKTSTRKQVIAWVESGVITPENIDATLKCTGIKPDKKAWQHFFDLLLLWLGTVAIGTAVIFFIAYNWSEMGRFLKFALVEAVMVGAVIAYLKFADNALISKAMLLLASLFLGGLMALFGQTYQTGADPWQLFFNWSLLMLPWAIISQFSVLWLIWLGLINISIILYHQVFSGFFGLLFSYQDVLWLLFAVNTAALVCWEMFSNVLPWLAERWAVRLIATASGSTVTWLCVYAIFDDKGELLPTVIWLIWSALIYVVYRLKRPDLYMLAGMCLSFIVVVTSFLARHLMDFDEVGGSFLISNLVIAMGAGAAVWLKKVHKEWQS